jgi:hypothetical protein
METKHCKGCDDDKPIEEFRFQPSKGRRLARCTACKRAYDNTWHKDHADLDRKLTLAKERNRKTAQAVAEYLQSHPCVDCGEDDIVVLDFDHLRDKDDNVAGLISRRCSLQRIMREIAKCVVRCANCHRRKTANEGGWFKVTFQSSGE